MSSYGTYIYIYMYMHTSTDTDTHTYRHTILRTPTRLVPPVLYWQNLILPTTTIITSHHRYVIVVGKGDKQTVLCVLIQQKKGMKKQTIHFFSFLSRKTNKNEKGMLCLSWNDTVPSLLKLDSSADYIQCDYTVGSSMFCFVFFLM